MLKVVVVSKKIVKLVFSWKELSTLRYKLVHNKCGTYVASFIAQQVGQVKVSVLVNGEHVKRSPNSIAIGCNYTLVKKPY